MIDLPTDVSSEQIAVDGFRLGKLQPKYDGRTFQLANYLEPRKLPKIPRTHTLSKKTSEAFPQGIGMMNNDRYGCCTISALGHHFQTWTAYGKPPWRPTDKAILDAYYAINGGVDRGAYALDALNHARKVGIDGNKIYAFAAVNPLDHEEVRIASTLFGGLYVGAWLPKNAQTQKIWDVAPGNGSEPGSWGGHMMSQHDYGKSTLLFATWGRWQLCTWDWWDRYVDEVYAIVEESFVGDDRRTSQGLSLKRLSEELARL